MYTYVYTGMPTAHSTTAGVPRSYALLALSIRYAHEYTRVPSIAERRFDKNGSCYNATINKPVGGVYFATLRTCEIASLRCIPAVNGRGGSDGAGQPPDQARRDEYQSRETKGFFGANPRAEYPCRYSFLEDLGLLLIKDPTTPLPFQSDPTFISDTIRREHSPPYPEDAKVFWSLRTLVTYVEDKL